MDRWVGKVAVVTGSSSGIGAAIAKDLAKAGMVVVGLARRVERVEALKDDLPESAKNLLHAVKCDVSKEEDILKTFKWVEEKFGGVDVLINNAGIVRQTDLLDADNTQMLREVVDTNVMGLVLCSREAYQSMKKRSVDGHIVHINSIAGHRVVNFPKLNIYCASKHAVTAITETMRNELRTAGTKIKVTSISPGGVRTEILPTDIVTSDMPLLESEDISEAVLYVLGTPPRVQVHELMIKPVGEIF
ncbi:AAEL017320-PA [Aedes aegypti]|uniref:NADP+-dependent farnesol dehydrogenase 2 n=2 Tax=Aedes aegypti TaxID=7159 RepID=D2WKE0_AEDAE|nr:NADP+-dependent farnesol dehydrogenase 2 [Aedes aegypti]EJY57754.1 AAEL017320-PA [Aedes aegypti]